ncbi:hypothetical protein [Roseivirga sp.]|uniref:hypothetical protein n=1 Tax=Roseivirga sp. TaxID=1964215 RepID=UPI002B269640|nr:hypothetical protein [Roseivirga sp.]
MKRHLFFFALLLFIGTSEVLAQEVQEYKTKILGPANLNYRKSPKRVVIADFQVNYQTALTLEDEKKGGKMFRGGLKGDAKAALTLVLEGLDQEALQKLTDQLYEDYVKELQAQGYEIAPIEEVWDHKAYKTSRDKRWELKAGNGPERGERFGMLLTRPSTQKFVVSQKEFDKTKAGIATLADYETSTERKMGSQKNDFIFNKVVVVVNSFEDGQGEGSKALGRLAGTAQVKAETNFKVSEFSVIKYNIGEVMPRGGIEVSDVLEKQKFDAFQRADIDKRGTDYGNIMTVWSVENREDSDYITVKCDPKKFIKGAQLGVNAFLKSAVQELVDKSN